MMMEGQFWGVGLRAADGGRVFESLDDRYVAELRIDGYTGGFYPKWYLTLVYDGILVRRHVGPYTSIDAALEGARAIAENSITCTTCKSTSYNTNDIKERYCGYCHEFAPR